MRGEKRKLRAGLTLTGYNKLLKEQGGVCWICARPPVHRRLHVDHNHKTGKIRGLLCWRCNTGLQKFSDESVRMRKAAEYIEREERCS